MKLVKNVTNNDGGTKTAADWKLSAGAAAPNDGRNFDSQTATPVFHNVLGGIEYTLSEDPNAGAGYSTTGVWSCDGGTFVRPNKITVPLGGAVTCTITNTDDTPDVEAGQERHQQRRRHEDCRQRLDVVGGGCGSQRRAQLRTCDGVAGTFKDVFGGAVYTLSEDPNAGAGYSTTGVWSCDGGTFVAPEQDHGAAGRRSDLHDHQHRRHARR